MPRAAELRQRAEAKRRWFEAKEHRCLAPGQQDGGGGGGSIAPEKEAAIALHSSAGDLARAILARKHTAEEVIRVFLRRSRVLGGAAPGGVNALTDALYDEALARAREIDAALAKGEYSAAGSGSGASAPLLLGVPISVKDHVDVAGTDSTTGAAAKCFRPRAKDALVVELLKVGGCGCGF